jgi:hypothetical protein
VANRRLAFQLTATCPALIYVSFQYNEKYEAACPEFYSMQHLWMCRCRQARMSAPERMWTRWDNAIRHLRLASKLCFSDCMVNWINVSVDVLMALTTKITPSWDECRVISCFRGTYNLHLQAETYICFRFDGHNQQHINVGSVHHSNTNSTSQSFLHKRISAYARCCSCSKTAYWRIT